MLLSRRQMIEAGAAAGALAAMSSPLLAAVSRSAARPARPRSGPAAASCVDPVIDPRLVARARAAFDRHRSALDHIDMVGIVDFAKAVGASRASSCSTPTAAGSPATSSPTAAARIPTIPASCSASRTSPAPRRARTAPM